MIKNNAAFTDGILKLVELYVDRKISFSELRNTLDSVTCSPAEEFIDFMLAHCFAFPVSKYHMLTRTFRDYEIDENDSNDEFVALKKRRDEHIKEINERLKLRLNFVFELSEDNMPFLIEMAPYIDIITKVKPIDEKLVEMATAPSGMEPESPEGINPERLIQHAYDSKSERSDLIMKVLKAGSKKWAELAGCEGLLDNYEPTPDAKLKSELEEIKTAISKTNYDETPLGRPHWAKGTEETLKAQDVVEKADKTLDTLQHVKNKEVVSKIMKPTVDETNSDWAKEAFSVPSSGSQGVIDERK